MSYPIRKHFLANFQALNRKKLVDNFNQTAQNLNNVRDYSLKRKSLDRASFRDNVFHKFSSNWDAQDPTTYDYFGFAPTRVIPNSVSQIEIKEYGEYNIYYSLEIGSGPADLAAIMVHIFVNGEVLGQGSQNMEMPWPWYIDSGEKRDNWAYSYNTADSAYADVVVDTTGSTNTSPATAYSIEDPRTSQTGATRDSNAIGENLCGQAVVTLNQGKFNIGLVWAYSRWGEPYKEEEGVMFTFHKCSLVIDRRMR